MSVRPIVRRELRDAIRRWWFTANAGVFAIAGLLFLLFGQNDALILGAKSYARILAGLMQLGLVFVPLLALVPAVSAIAGDRESGTLDYLLAQPITRTGVYRAKWAGVAIAVTLSVIAGLSVTAALASARGVPGTPTVALVACTCLLATTFVSLGMWISAMSPTRARALSIGLTLWVALLGLGSLGVISVFVRWGSPAWVLEVWSLVNPVEAYRMVTLAILDPDLQMLGPVGGSLLTALGREGLIAASIGCLVFWTGLGFGCGSASFANAMGVKRGRRP